uniref:Ionotropic glutamate receptor C-terminal domain-containing protein n=1 Tax=Trichogramma kaykai TaxID=54128 RepID=A0ABD2W830_9HYME
MIESGTLDSVRKSSTWRVIVHNYDPFEDVINSSRNCDSNTLWHPNKLDDLRGHSLKVDLSDDPPFAYVTRNATGHVLAMDGSAAKILDFIAQGINFTPDIVPRVVEMNNDVWTEASYEDYFSELRKGRAEFIANDRTHPIDGLERGEFDYSHQIGFDKHCLVVPVLESPRYDVLRHLLHPFLSVLVLAMFKIGTAYLPNFDQRNWRWLVTLQIFLGISVHKNPHNSSERIFMMCIIIFSIYNLGYIFSEIQNIKLGSRQQIDIDVLSDLVKFNISIQANYDELAPDERSIEYNITSKIPVQNWISRNHCIYILLKYKNVSCLMSRLFAKMRVLHHMKQLNQRKMKMMRNCITSRTTRFPFQNDSPYLTGVNKLIRLLQLSGIRNNLFKIDVMTVKIMEKSEKEPIIDSYVQFNIVVPIYIGLGGLTLAATVFTFEIILGLREKNNLTVKLINRS